MAVAPVLTLYRGGAAPVELLRAIEDAKRSLGELAQTMADSDQLREPVTKLAEALERRWHQRELGRIRASRQEESAEADAVEEFLPVVIEDGREIGRREHVNICSTHEQANDEAERRAESARRTNPTARADAAPSGRAVGA
jgi:hypothetical protein